MQKPALTSAPLDNIANKIDDSQRLYRTPYVAVGPYDANVEVARIHASRYTIAGEIMLMFTIAENVRIDKFLFGARIGTGLVISQSASNDKLPDRVVYSFSVDNYVGLEDYDIVVYATNIDGNPLGVSSMITGMTSYN